MKAGLLATLTSLLSAYIELGKSPSADAPPPDHGDGSCPDGQPEPSRGRARFWWLRRTSDCSASFNMFDRRRIGCLGQQIMRHPVVRMHGKSCPDGFCRQELVSFIANTGYATPRPSPPLKTRSKIPSRKPEHYLRGQRTASAALVREGSFRLGSPLQRRGDRVRRV